MSSLRENHGHYSAGEEGNSCLSPGRSSRQQCTPGRSSDGPRGRLEYHLLRFPQRCQRKIGSERGKRCRLEANRSLPQRLRSYSRPRAPESARRQACVDRIPLTHQPTRDAEVGFSSEKVYLRGNERDFSECRSEDTNGFSQGRLRVRHGREIVHEYRGKGNRLQGYFYEGSTAPSREVRLRFRNCLETYKSTPLREEWTSFLSGI